MYSRNLMMLSLKELRILPSLPLCRCIHSSIVCNKTRVAGKVKRTRNFIKPLTYEQTYLPEDIGHAKNWNSWNTSAILGGTRAGMTAVEDLFIRKFMEGTWHNLWLSDIIIKRQFNIIRVGGLIYRGISPRKMYFLIGYSEELLSNWLQCPVKLELQTVADKKDIVFKYV